MKNYLAFLFCIGFMLSACGHVVSQEGVEDTEGTEGAEEVVDEREDAEVVEDAKEEDASDAEDANDAEEAEEPVVDTDEAASVGYQAYSEGVVGNGSPALLFFYASWCPKCQTNDGRLTEAYGEGAAGISTYKIDYDTADALKSKYGVVQQDTFVLIDGEGNAVKETAFPSHEELLSLIQ